MSESVTMTATVSELSATSFKYTLTLDDIGPTAIGGLWIAWAPGILFLPNTPSAATAPTGWAPTIIGGSIQYAADSSASYVASGGTLTGFTFTVSDAPSVVFGESAAHPRSAVLTSFAYDTSAIDPGPSDPGVEFVVACFAKGSRILTVDGEIAVEHLHAGHAVPALMSSQFLPVRWLGRTSVDCSRHPHPHAVWPVRISPGAFGAGRPARPLSLSPDHAVHLGGALVPIRHLINGVTIAQQPVGAIEYWHVELPGHAVLLAEGLPVESYLDTGNRLRFDLNAIPGATAQAARSARRP
jgi:hypothetical protein